MRMYAEHALRVPIVLASKLSHHVPQREDGPEYQLCIVLCAQRLANGGSTSFGELRLRRRPRYLAGR